MTWRSVSSLAAAATVVGMLSLAPMRTIAQSSEKANPKGKNLGGPGGVIAVNGVRDENLPPPPAGPTPHAVDGKPNLSGVWLSGNYNFANMGGALPLQPWALRGLPVFHHPLGPRRPRQGSAPRGEIVVSRKPDTGEVGFPVQRAWRRTHGRCGEIFVPHSIDRD